MSTELDQLNCITDDVIGAAIEVHRALGPGLLESAYEVCEAFELIERGREVARQVPLPLVYKGVKLDCGYRLDLLIDNLVIVEIKAVDLLTDVHKAQLLSYLKLSGKHVGLLINFNVTMLKNGIVRVVNNLPESPRTQRSPRLTQRS
jgi:GxxExxY protein